MNLKCIITHFKTRDEAEKINCLEQHFEIEIYLISVSFFGGEYRWQMDRASTTALNFLSCFLKSLFLFNWSTAVFWWHGPKLEEQPIFTSWEWRGKQEIKVTEKSAWVTESPGKVPILMQFMSKSLLKALHNLEI